MVSGYYTDKGGIVHPITPPVNYDPVYALNQTTRQVEPDGTPRRERARVLTMSFADFGKKKMMQTKMLHEKHMSRASFNKANRFLDMVFRDGIVEKTQYMQMKNDLKRDYEKNEKLSDDMKKKLTNLQTLANATVTERQRQEKQAVQEKQKEQESKPQRSRYDPFIKLNDDVMSDVHRIGGDAQTGEDIMSDGTRRKSREKQDEEEDEENINVPEKVALIGARGG